MDSKESKDPLGEKPLFTDEHGNTFFPQEESDHVVRQRILEEERLKRLANPAQGPLEKPKNFSAKRKTTHSPIDNSAGMRGIGKYRSNR